MSNFVNESQPYWLVNNANAVVTNSATNLLGFFVNGANGGGAITLSNGTGGDAVINNYVPLIYRMGGGAVQVSSRNYRQCSRQRHRQYHRHVVCGELMLATWGSSVPGFVLPGASADLFFSAGAYYPNGPLSSLLSTTRAQTNPSYAQTTSGLWIAFAANQPRITNNGLLIEQASTNQIISPRDMTNAAWVKVNMTAALTATGIEGAANSASTLTATAGNATILQTLTLTSQPETYSVFLKRVSGTGTINITENNGVSWTPVVLTSVYQRFQVEATLANPVCGIQIVTNGDVIAADFNQDEELAFATSPMLTTRAADVITAQGALLTAIINSKAMRVVTNMGNIVTGARLFSDNTGAFATTASTTSVELFNVGAVNNVTANYGSGTFFGVTKAALGFGAASFSVVANGGTLASSANAFGAMTGPVWIGGNSAGTRQINGYLLRLTVGQQSITQFNNMTTGSNPQ